MHAFALVVFLFGALAVVVLPHFGCGHHAVKKMMHTLL